VEEKLISLPSRKKRIFTWLASGIQTDGSYHHTKITLSSSAVPFFAYPINLPLYICHFILCTLCFRQGNLKNTHSQSQNESYQIDGFGNPSREGASKGTKDFKAHDVLTSFVWLFISFWY
jgi:hypothetical protein